MDLFFRGLLIGISIAAPVGPIGVICIRRSLIDGWKSGLAAGLGAALADCFYAILAVIGLAAVTQVFTAINPFLHVGGGLLLLYIGLKMFRSIAVNLTDQADPSRVKNVSAPGVLFETFLLTLANPITILSFSAVLTAFGVERLSIKALYVVSGVFFGSAAWWLLLSGGVSRFRYSVDQRIMRIINWCSGCIIGAFGIWSLVTAGR